MVALNNICEVSVENPYEKMRDQIIKMQQYIANQGSAVNQRPDVAKAVLDLFRARSSLERLMLELNNERGR